MGPVKIPYPATVYIPSVYFLPTKSDTLYLDGEPYPIQTVDTAKIIEEYITQNTYESMLLTTTTASWT